MYNQKSSGLIVYKITDEGHVLFLVVEQHDEGFIHHEAMPWSPPNGNLMFYLNEIVDKYRRVCWMEPRVYN